MNVQVRLQPWLLRSTRTSVMVFLLWASAAPGGEILSTNSTWKYFKGLSEASSPDPTAWRLNGFDDSSWLIGQAPFYYENSPGSATAYSGNTDLADMFGGYTCIFMRQTFVITNVAGVSQLELYSLSDDGFIAWINGIEVTRFNMPSGAIPYDGTASPALAEPVPPQDDLLDAVTNYLVAGTNVLAIQAFNSSLSASSDFLIEASLSALLDTIPPTVTQIIPTPGIVLRSLKNIEVDFSEGVAGVDAADLLINGKAATNVTQFAPWQYVFDFPQPATGAVQVAWAGNNGIHDLSSLANPFSGGNWAYTLNPNAPAPAVEISEFMADNKHTIHDEDGDSSDWIEIFNPTASAVNLGGWALTDDPQKPMEWRFPNYTLAANGYLLVFASGKDRTNASAELHTNFKLSAAGQYLALVDVRTNIVSAFAPSYPSQQTDVSYGRDAVSPDAIGYFTTTTPGLPNINLGSGFAPEVNFEKPSGNFITPFSLSLWTASTNAEIHYTLDGSDPIATSSLYTQSLSITNTVRVRTRAFQTGLLPGPLHTESYLLLNVNLVNTTTTLPVIVLHNFSAGAIPVSVDQLVDFSVYEPRSGVTSLTNPPTLHTRAGIHVRGSSTQGLPKQSWSVEFWDENGDSRNASPLGLPGESDWALYAPNNFEPVLMHNPLIYQLSNEVGRYAPLTRFVVVYLNTFGGALSAGNYNGIYVLEEKIKIGKDRVDVDKLQPENSTLPSLSGGYQMKIDRPGPGESGFFAAGQSIVFVDPSEAEIKTPQRAPQNQYLQNYMNAFGNALYGANYRDPTNGYRAYADVGSWVDHHILNVMAFNVDALRLSAYFYKERSGKLFFGPIWDFDRSQGSTDNRDFNPQIWRSPVPDFGTDFFNYTWWGQMFTDIDFWQAWIDRYQQLRGDVLSTNHIFADIDDLANEVRAEQPREANRWATLTRPRSGLINVSGYSYNFPGTYQGEVNFLKQWYQDRLNFMDTNFVARPVFSTNGGVVPKGFALSISGALGASIYYTTNGTDPRMSGGAVSPNARSYTGPVILSTNARVVARCLNPSHQNLTGPDNPPLSSSWSGLQVQTYIVTAPQLIVSELMYHPAPPPIGSTNSAEDFEYVELKNIGSNTLNLVGISFTNGIDYTFTSASRITVLGAGQRVLLIKNQAAFQSRYPGVTNFAGEYGGNLSNSGERLTLVGAMLEPILNFTYNNSWYPITDGLGFSLVVVDENAPASDWSLKDNWRPSGEISGSPGGPDAAAPSFPKVLINEALTHTDLPEVDAVELFNSESAAADIGGWFLTDDFNQPQKYQFPAGTLIPGGGYLVVDESQFNSGSPTSFRLSSLGEEVYLFSADSRSNLTGYYHGFSFGAAQNGVTFGRYITSIGAEHFPSQATNSLGVANVGPRVGPIVISEVMYDPLPLSGPVNNTVDEFIELRNITLGSAPLFHPLFPTNTWRIDGGVSFTFPPGLQLAKDEHLLVVSFDPVHQPQQLAEFVARYGVAANTQVLGPFAGALGNDNDKIELLKPDAPQVPGSPNPGFVPYVLVDEVDYASAPPWPTNALDTGLSLQRINTGSYGNDPINWTTAAPTAGQANPVILPALNIQVAADKLVLSWPLWASDFLLENRNDLASPSPWITVPTPRTSLGGFWLSTNDVGSAATYYRLHKQ